MTPETSSNAVINANGLCLTFDSSDGPVHALKDVDLQIDKWDFVSFIGPSGCGKSSLLRLLAGLEQPFIGSVTGLAQSHIGFVFQEPTLLAWRSVADNITLPLKI